MKKLSTKALCAVATRVMPIEIMLNMVESNGGKLAQIHNPPTGPMTVTYTREGEGYELALSGGKIVMTCIHGRDAGESAQVWPPSEELLASYGITGWVES